MALRRSTYAKMEKVITHHEDFRMGNLHGERFEMGHNPPKGRLPERFAIQLNSDNSEHDVYVVYSYYTPIGWTKLDGNDNWVIPDESYSPSTSNHQSRLRSITR